MLWILLTAAVTLSGDFPPDPSDTVIIDRDLIRCETAGEEHTIYITLYNTADSTGTIELQSGVRLQDGWSWETVCIWNPMNFNGKPIFVKPGSVLSVQRSDSSLYITWISGLELGYVEGLCSLYLNYNLQSRSYEEFFLD